MSIRDTRYEIRDTSRGDTRREKKEEDRGYETRIMVIGNRTTKLPLGFRHCPYVFVFHSSVFLVGQISVAGPSLPTMGIPQAKKVGSLEVGVVYYRQLFFRKVLLRRPAGLMDSSL